jgi:hypothetical protein
LDMAAVLLDASPAALRALELASIPNFLLSHEDNQLLVLHGWTASKDLAAHQAIPAAIDAVSKSRVAQHTLNYKIEMLRVQSGDAPTVAATGPTPVHPTPTPVGNTPGPGDKTTKAPKKVEAKGAAAAAPEPLAAQASKPEKSPEEVAKVIAEYVRDRTKHHGAYNVLLGVGAGMAGKSIAVGSVAKAVVAQFRSVDGYRLFLLKATGPAIRPTASLRIVVLVVPGQPLGHLESVLSFSNPQQRGDRVGVLIVVNNGRKKPEANAVVSMDSPTKAPLEDDEAEDSETHRLVRDTTKQCAALLAARGLADVSTGGSAVDDAASTIAQETYPLINHLTLEPTNHLPTPTVDEVPQQLVKFIGAIKCDFLALPPASHYGAVVGDAVVNACLAAAKPHVLLL